LMMMACAVYWPGLGCCALPRRQLLLLLGRRRQAGHGAWHPPSHPPTAPGEGAPW
jgi:hypothetical protein